jgi:hypothetical protein
MGTPDACKCAVVLAAVKDKPFGWRFAPSLTAAARAGLPLAWVGTEGWAPLGAEQKD